MNARSEDVHFWMAIPRKEISARKDGKPAPIVMVGHGYTLNRVDTMVAFAGALARTGNAVIAIDCPSHGPNIDPAAADMYGVLAGAFGVGPLVKPLLATRAKDQNGDGAIDSGADFWTSYLFHTRDVVRQCTLDHMQLIRILRSFDGKRRDADRNGDGEPELAGDFDGDGVIDVGGDASIAITGTSLGGIIASTVAGVEPGLDVSAPIAGGCFDRHRCALFSGGRHGSGYPETFVVCVYRKNHRWKDEPRRCLTQPQSNAVYSL